MGGRGSGGGRSGGGGGASNKNNEVTIRSISQIYQEKYSKMSDKELNRAYINSQNAMNKERVKLQHEENKLSALVNEFKTLKDGDPKVESKWNEIDKQTSVVNDARSIAGIREQIYYLAVNEKYNVRGKQSTKDLKKMTDGQLNSYYNRSYNELHKAQRQIEKTKNSKTKAKYTKLFEEHDNNFWKANAERSKRGLNGKDW